MADYVYNAVQENISFHNGVSQQDPTLRLDSQVEDSINCYHTLELGTRRRNPTELIKEGVGITSDSWIYNYDRGTSEDLLEKYSIVINETGMKILDLETGNEVPLTNSGGTYLSPFSTTGFSAVTVKDVTYITNRNKKVELNDFTGTTDISKIAYLWIKRADPIDGYVYNVTVNGVTKTSAGQLNTSSVASDLTTKLNTISGITAVYSGNIIKITGTITGVVTSDNVGDSAIGYVWKLVPTENDLPSSMPYDGAIIQVGGLKNSDAKYWLKVTDSRWVETRDPNIQYEFNNTTMPHKLTRLFDVDDNPYFVFEPIEWDNREVGDEDVSPKPSVVGSQVVDMFFFRNRLGFITPSNIIMSEDGYYYNFWKTSQVTLIDSDRIDIGVDSKKVVTLHYAEFLQDDMIIFGDRTQFKLSYAGVLSSTTISASVVSEYDMNTKVRPLSIDDRIYFVAKNGSYTSVFTYFKDQLDELNRAENISAHIPSYLDSDIAQIVGSSVNSTILFRSSSNSNTLYIYKYFLDNRKLIQSSWFKWTLDGTIHSIFTNESKLYILLERNNRITDEEWVTFDGTWNDDKLWEDAYIWLDEASTSTSNLESMNIFPNELDSVFYDIGEVEYSSDITLSRYIPKVSGKARLSDITQIKTVFIKAKDNSKFDIVLTNKGRERVIDKKYSDRKLYVGGKPNDNIIKITSNSNLGFEINGVAIEARINNRSRSI